jgi:hypothetical protein
MKLQQESFGFAYELCDFVNNHKVTVEQICVINNRFYLFYWE